MNRFVNKPMFLFLRSILKLTFRMYGRLARRFRIVGKNRLPQSRQPCILICNHAAFVDTLYVIAALRPRFVVCGAQPKYFSGRVKRLVLGILNIMKVENKEQFLRDCCRLLQMNEVILIYPAMGRVSDGLGEFKTWAAEVAIASQARVIPLYLYGTTKGHGSHKRLMVGDPIPLNTNPEVLTQDFYQSIMALEANLMSCQEGSLGIQ